MILYGIWLFIKTALFTLAAILVVPQLFKVLFKSKEILSSLLSIKTDLSARYGKNSWAVITGPSDGIGKGFAFELAKDGFNIVLVGRNREKLEGVEKELKSQYSSIQTKIVVEDFKNAYDEGFSRGILEQLKGLEMSILINNAGMTIADAYADVSEAEIRDIVMVNALAPAIITRAFLPLLAERKRSAIITVSSITADYPKSIRHIYGATKSFVDYLSRSLKDEHRNIDFLCLRPAYVATKMTGKKPGGVVITPKNCARSTLRALGHTDATYGNWNHSIQASIYHQLPAFLKKRIF